MIRREGKMGDKVTGVMVYYYFVCKRKLWFFCHQINMESENEDVILGKILDDNNYQKDDKHINIDDVINIDFIREETELHEVKKSRVLEEAGVWQLKYYLYYLQKRGVVDLKGKIDYPLLKKTMKIELYDKDIKEIERIIEEISVIKRAELPPALLESKVCRKCAYFDLYFV